jgi:hypothetical protein
MARTGMQHLTVDTGDTRVSLRDEIAPAGWAWAWLDARKEG